MTRDDRIAAAEDLIRNGISPEMTLREAMHLVEGLIFEATLELHGGRVAAAARALGCSREGGYLLRRRHGLGIGPSGERPVPEDWRERLGA